MADTSSIACDADYVLPVAKTEQRRNEMAGKREIPEETCRSAANPGVTRPGIGSPWWEASRLTAQPPRPLIRLGHCDIRLNWNHHIRRFEVKVISISSRALNSNGSTVICDDLISSSVMISDRAMDFSVWSSYLGEPVSIPGGVASGFSHVGSCRTMHGAGRRDFSGMCLLPHHCIPALLHSYLATPSSALESSVLITPKSLKLQFTNCWGLAPALIFAPSAFVSNAVAMFASVQQSLTLNARERFNQCALMRTNANIKQLQCYGPRPPLSVLLGVWGNLLDRAREIIKAATDRRADGLEFGGLRSIKSQVYEDGEATSQRSNEPAKRRVATRVTSGSEASGLRASVQRISLVWSRAGIKWCGKREIPKKTRQAAASSGIFPICKYPGHLLSSCPLARTLKYALVGAVTFSKAEKRGSDKEDNANRIKCAIASTRKALNWRVVFSSCCVKLWDLKR
ncbi:hypothetical protein PR048_014037 [Dryococelus australis]|uniref:Uncharacterized protein n=1 Tax=Dryococelus australis TaxID=614101 RepID=A0ABQ9HTW1_9NEOP|nr:hypothetical protein PR048_014037 [Dryococelus australis]